MPNYKSVDSDGIAVKHYGVPGMKWGVRRQNIRSGLKRASNNKVFKALIYNKDTSLLGKKGRAAFKKQNIFTKEGRAGLVKGGKDTFNKISNSKAFKSLVIDKDKSVLTKSGRKNAKTDLKKAKSVLDKVTSSKAFKTLVIDKDNPSILNKKGQAALAKGKAALKKGAEKFNKAQVRDQNNAIKKLKAKGDKKSLEEAKYLQDELEYVFTPEELKRYS